MAESDGAFDAIEVGMDDDPSTTSMSDAFGLAAAALAFRAR